MFELLTFQSRNRGSFDFKSSEKLIPTWFAIAFQSRNRGSFDFKTMLMDMKGTLSIGFNLVIEVLLISSEMQFDDATTQTQVVSIS